MSKERHLTVNSVELLVILYCRGTKLSTMLTAYKFKGAKFSLAGKTSFLRSYMVAF